MKHLRIKSVKDIEKAIWLVYRYIPQPPKSIQKHLTKTLPYISVIAGSYLLSVAIFPFIFPVYPLDPLQNTGLFNFNVILSRLLFGVMGGITFVSFEKLAARKLMGWYNLFYITLFLLFFILVVFNIWVLIALLTAWYILFAVKPDFS